MHELPQLIERRQLRTHDLKETLISRITDCIENQGRLDALVAALYLPDDFIQASHDDFGPRVRKLVDFMISADRLGDLIDMLGNKGFEIDDVNNWTDRYIKLRQIWAIMNVDPEHSLPLIIADGEDSVVLHYNRILSADDVFEMQLGKTCTDWRVLLFHLLFDEKKFLAFTSTSFFDKQNPEMNSLYNLIMGKFMQKDIEKPYWGVAPSSRSICIMLENQAERGCYVGRAVSLPYRKVIRDTSYIGLDQIDQYINEIISEFKDLYLRSPEIVELILDFDDLFELDYNKWIIHAPDNFRKDVPIDVAFAVGVRDLKSVKMYNADIIKKLKIRWTQFNSDPITYLMLHDHLVAGTMGAEFLRKDHNSAIQQFTTTDADIDKLKEFIGKLIDDNVPAFLFFRKCPDFLHVPQCENSG
ncbi:MAG: hypothetical protein QM730_14190 [Anaerolineales bacterium]